MTFDPKRLPEDLVRAYRSKRCASLVGAGASKGAGLPLWGELLEQMIQEGEKQHVLPADKATEYRKLIVNPSKFLMAATGLQEELAGFFNPFIHRIFIDSKPQPTALHDALAKADQMQFVVTTNYDTLIERRYRVLDPDVSVCTFKDVGEVQSRLARREFFILKAHGDAAKAGNGIVLTDLDYRRLLYRERAYQSLLSSIFTMFTIVFIGASMTDPEVNLLLNYIADAFSPGAGPMHYALMAEEEITSVEKVRWLRDLNVQFVPISKADNYAEINDFLLALAASV